MSEIVLRRGTKRIVRLPLGDLDLSIGRDDTNNLVIDCPDVSRRHARLTRQDGTAVFEDLGSANGSFLGGSRISRRVLRNGDEIALGDHTLLYLASDDGTAEPVDPTEEARDHTIVYDLDDMDLAQVVLGGTSESKVTGQASADRLKALFEISQTIEAAKDFSGVLAAIMDKAISIMHAERGFLMLQDPDSKELTVHVARDIHGDISDVDRETTSRTLMQRVLETKKPVLVHAAQSGEWQTQSILANQIHSALCAPLMTRDEVTGVIYVDHRSSPLAFSNDDVAFFTTFALQAKSAIDNSRAYWELVDCLFRASDDFIVVCSVEGKIKQVNRAGAVLLGRDELELTTMHLTDLVPAEDRERAVSLCADTLARGVASGREMRLVPKEGRPVPMSISSFSLRDRGGQALGLCLIGRDLSAIKFLIHQLERRTQFIRKTFGRYLSDEIVNSILESPEGLQLGGEKRRLTILMSDLRGFTSLAEQLQPEQVVTMLNTYLGTMAEILLRYNGTIDEFIGDAVLAIFGAPIQRPDDAERAAACAVAMQLAMEEVNRKNAEAGLPHIEMGIGLNTGELVVGNIGSHRRAKYGVVGSVVNTTARIESFTIGGQILIAESTLEDAGATLKTGRTLTIHAKGNRQPFAVHELRGVGGEHNLSLPERSETFHDLAHAVAVSYIVLEGKTVGDTVLTAELVRLSDRGGWLRGVTPPDTLDNLKLEIRDGEQVFTDVYAKVTARDEQDPQAFAIRFTSVPPEAAGYLKALLPG